MVPGSRANSGDVAPGSVQPPKATPSDRVRAFVAVATRSTPSRSYPPSAAAPAILNTTTSPATPRRRDHSAGGALAMSSVTRRMRVSIPSARSVSAAAPKLRTSPA